MRTAYLTILILAIGARSSLAALPTAPQVPAFAAALALQDLQAFDKLRPDLTYQRRYIWLPNGTQGEAASAKIALNIAVAHAAIDYNPPAIAGGALIPVDLAVLCPPTFDEKGNVNTADTDRVVRVWNGLPAIEPYFHAHLKHQQFDCPPYIADNGKTYDYRVEDISIPAPHLGPAGVELERLLGNPDPQHYSFCPVVRLDWFLWASLSSIDGGRYFDFRGLVVGKTKLEDYLKSRGYDLKNIQANNGDDRLAMMSKVTDRARGVTVIQGGFAKATTSPNIGFLTDDNFEASEDPQENPFFSLLDHKANAHEVIITLSSGWPEFTIFDGKGLLLAEVADNVATDSTVPPPFKPRLHGAISCLRCHAPNENVKPMVNEVQVMFQSRGRPLLDLSGKGNQAANFARLDSAYRGDLRTAIKSMRDAFDRRIFAVSGMGAKEALRGLSDSFGAREFAWVNARQACLELGFIPPAADTLGTASFIHFVPARLANGTYLDDPIVVRLSSQYFDDTAGQFAGLQVQRREFELAYADLADRALPALIGAVKAQEQKAAIEAAVKSAKTPK